MLRIAALTLILLATTQSTLAAVPANLSDEEHVTRAFGTVAVLHAGRQVVDPSQHWWGELASQELSNPAYLTGIINSRRMDKGLTPLLNPEYSGIVMESEETDGGGFRYPISFTGMRPSEVQALVAVLGGPEKILPGASSISYEPLTRSYIYASSYADPQTGISPPLTLTVGPTTIDATADVDFTQLRNSVAQILNDMFGQAVPFDFTLSRSQLLDGTRTTDVSIYIDLNPPPPLSEEELHHEHGEH